MINRVAQQLNIGVNTIKYIKKFKYVYLVVFNTRRRPTFVSKAKVETNRPKPKPKPIPSDHKVVSLDTTRRVVETYQVMARTEIRRGRWGSRNRGLKLKNLETSEYCWLNNERPYDQDIQVADYIRYDGRRITVIRDAPELLAAF